MKTPAKLAEGAQQNELQYTKKVHNMMKNPKERHLRDELNRKKICYFCNKVVWIPTYHMLGCSEQEQSHI
jgi:hypothetical protein